MQVGKWIKKSGDEEEKAYFVKKKKKNTLKILLTLPIRFTGPPKYLVSTLQKGNFHVAQNA